MLIPLTNGAVTLPVSETPVFVCVSGAPEHYPVKKIPVMSIQLGDRNGSVETKTYCNTERFFFGTDTQPQDKLLREFSELFDEQSLVPETIRGHKIAVFDHWSTASGILEFYNNRRENCSQATIWPTPRTVSCT